MTGDDRYRKHHNVFLSQISPFLSLDEINAEIKEVLSLFSPQSNFLSYFKNKCGRISFIFSSLRIFQLKHFPLSIDKLLQQSKYWCLSSTPTHPFLNSLSMSAFVCFEHELVTAESPAGFMICFHVFMLTVRL